MDPHVRDELQAVNERYLEMMAQWAQGDEGGPSRLIAQIKQELLVLDPASRRRAAERPFLLVDFHFCDDARWRALRTNALKSKSDAWPGSLPRRAVVELAQHVLTLAWVMARRMSSASLGAQLGLAPRVATLLADFKLEELKRVAERHVLLLRPRWEERPDLWRRLLTAARANRPEDLQSIDVHGVQLLASDLLAQPS